MNEQTICFEKYLNVTESIMIDLVCMLCAYKGRSRSQCLAYKVKL
jgi:hypothetical protein